MAGVDSYLLITTLNISHLNPPKNRVALGQDTWETKTRRATKRKWWGKGREKVWMNLRLKKRERICFSLLCKLMKIIVK